MLKNGGLNSEDDYHYTGQQAASCDSARQARCALPKLPHGFVPCSALAMLERGRGVLCSLGAVLFSLAR